MGNGRERKIYNGMYIDVSKNGGTQQPWVFLLKMIILGCFGGTPIFGNTHIDYLVILKDINLNSGFLQCDQENSVAGSIDGKTKRICFQFAMLV